MSELLSCPFCGGEADVMLCQSAYGQSYRIHHEHASPCPAAYVNGLQFRTEAEAIAAWNTRADYHGYEQAAIEAWESIKAWNSRAEQGSEPPYDELLRCLENDWNISASWDGLRRFWNIELTEEGVRMRDAELNSRADRTCKFTIEDNMNETEGMGDVWIECSACHCVFDYYADDWLMNMSYCPNCGAKVLRNTPKCSETTTKVVGE